jgi:YVTN family beta-propeller protein
MSKTKAIEPRPQDFPVCPEPYGGSAGLLYCANVQGNNVTIVDLAREVSVGSIVTPANPSRLDVSADGTLMLAACKSGVVAFIATATRAVVTKLPVVGPAQGIAISPDGLWAYCTHPQTDQVSLIDIRGRAVAAVLSVGDCPQNTCFNPAGTLAYVTNSYSGDVYVINSRSVVGKFATGLGASGIAIAGDGSTLCVSNSYANTVTIHNAKNGALVETLGGFTRPGDIALTDSTLLVCNGNANEMVSVSVDTGATTRVAVGMLPYAVAATAGKRYVANYQAMSLSIVDAGGASVLKTLTRIGVYPVALALGK